MFLWPAICEGVLILLAHVLSSKDILSFFNDILDSRNRESLYCFIAVLHEIKSLKADTERWIDKELMVSMTSSQVYHMSCSNELFNYFDYELIFLYLTKVTDLKLFYSSALVPFCELYGYQVCWRDRAFTVQTLCTIRIWTNLWYEWPKSVLISKSAKREKVTETVN